MRHLVSLTFLLLLLFGVQQLTAADAFNYNNDLANNLGLSLSPEANQLSAEPAKHSFLGQFTRDLGTNFVHLFSRQNLLPFAIGAGTTALTSLDDYHIKKYFQTRYEDDMVQTGATMGGGYAMVGTTAGMLLVSRLFDNTRFRGAAYDVAQAMVLDAGLTTALKYATDRVRPLGTNHLSFPSGHTSSMVALSTVLAHHYGMKVGLPLFIASAFVASSRLVGNYHYLSDVAGGATVGYIVGNTVVHGAPSQARRLTWSPATAADGTGTGLGLTIRW